MIGLRTYSVGMLLALCPVAGLAQPAVSLASIDRDLSRLCARLPNAGEDGAALRARMAQLWRQRTAYLVALPAGQRAAVEAQPSQASSQCLTQARAAAAPLRPLSHGYAKKSNSPLVYRDGVGESPTAAGRPTPARRPASANGGGPPATVDTSISVDRQPVSRDEAQLTPFFPWPPPAPSGRRLLQVADLGGNTPVNTWGHVADRFVAYIRGGRFRSWGFYSAPGGFAVVPQIEQLDDRTGQALPGDERWATEIRIASTSVLEGLLTVRRPKGIYRAIVFVLTTDPRTGDPVTDPRRMMEAARRWGISGAVDLPASLRDRPVATDQRLFALVYEFQSPISGPTTVNSPGRWDIDRHLRDAGLALPQ